jgi:aminoglycoside 2'-N-acetyltransferase I
MIVKSARREDLDAEARAAIIGVCIAANDNDDFENLFSYIPPGGPQALAYRGSALVSHAVATTRWLQAAGQTLLRTAFVDAVATLPACEGRGFGSAVMRHLAEDVDGVLDIGCLQTARIGFYRRLGWELWRARWRGGAPTTASSRRPSPDVLSERSAAPST